MDAPNSVCNRRADRYGPFWTTRPALPQTVFGIAQSNHGFGSGRVDDPYRPS